MKPYRSRLLFALSVLMFAAGCSESGAPMEGSSRLEGEYGFSLNGNSYDSGTPSPNDGRVILSPLASVGTNAVQFNVYLYFELQDGTFGSVQIYAPIPNPGSQTINIGSYQQDIVASASINYDSSGYTFYESLPGGTITITKFDTVNNLVSGSFQFTASPSNSPNDIFRVTSGYFNDIPIVGGAYGQGSVTAVVNGVPFSTDTANREIVYPTLNQGRLILAADGQGPSQNSFIEIENIPLTTGTFVANGPEHLSDTTLYFIYGGRAGTNYGITSADTGTKGELTITAVDIPNRRISGTFQFSGSDTLGHSVTMTSGEINNVQWEP